MNLALLLLLGMFARGKPEEMKFTSAEKEVIKEARKQLQQDAGFRQLMESYNYKATQIDLFLKTHHVTSGEKGYVAVPYTKTEEMNDREPYVRNPGEKGYITRGLDRDETHPEEAEEQETLGAGPRRSRKRKLKY